MIADGLGNGSSMNHTGSSMDHAGGTSSPTAGKPVEVVMKDNSFSPDHLGVKKGETVTFRFTNSGSQLHEAVIGNQDAQAQEEMAMQHGGHSGMGITNTVEVKPEDVPITVEFRWRPDELTRQPYHSSERNARQFQRVSR
jgi:plastocyanin